MRVSGMCGSEMCVCVCVCVISYVELTNPLLVQVFDTVY